MAGNKTLQKFKDSKIPKKGKGKVIKEVPIHIEPNTQSVVIGKIPKDQTISWISKSVCDEREWIRCNEEYNYGYIVGYEKDGSSNLDISSIKDKTDGKKNKKNLKIKPNEIVPITKEDINLGNEALNEILNGDDKNSDKDNESISNSTEIEENFISDDKKKIKIPEIKKEDENFDNWDFDFDQDISKIDYVVNENNKLLNDLFNQMNEENNKSNNESNKNTNERKIDDNLISKAIDSLNDVLPGNDKLSEKDKLLEALNLIPGGKHSKKEKSFQEDNIEEEDAIRRSKTISLKGKNYPKNFPK